MPRGGSSKGGHNNFLSPENSITGTDSELAVFTRHARNMFALSNNRVDLHDEKAVYSAIIEYFNMCERENIRPGNLGLYAALGMNRQDVHNVLTGKSKSKVSPTCIDIIKSAKLAMSAYRETLANSGKLNPVTYIFQSKNFDGLTDTQTIEIAPADRQQADLSPEQIQKAIEQDIPIDVESD